MNHKSRSLSRSRISTNLLSTQSTVENPLFSSTRYLPRKEQLIVNHNRRKEIIPTPNKPKTNNNSFSINIEMNPLDQQSTDVVINHEDRISENTSNHDTDEKFIESCNNHNRNVRNSNILQTKIDSSQQLNPAKVVDTAAIKLDNAQSTKIITTTSESNFNSTKLRMHTNDEQDLDITNLDEFILQHFSRYSGTQDVIQWLEDTENKFNLYRLNRQIRFDVIPFLIEGEARRRYIRNRKNIKSFDDFYEFLLRQFDNFDNTEHLVSNQRTISINEDNRAHTSQETTLYTTKESVSNNKYNVHDSIDQSSVAMVNHGTTNIIGDVPVDKTIVTSDEASSHIKDETINDLRRAIVANLIKNPKIFKGGQENVYKWIEEMEHLFEIAHIHDDTKLDFVSYSLRGDAFDWFRTYRSSFTSWQVFVHKLTAAFTSTFHEELAFKKLETYSQGENQPICNFFNEILRLCKEADHTMSEATKLKHLLNKAKPSIQFEVRKKKPRTIADFLQFAKETEELIQLSNLSFDQIDSSRDKKPEHDKISSTQRPFFSSQPVVSRDSTPFVFHRKPVNDSRNYYRNFNSNFRPFNNREIYSNSTNTASQPTKVFQHKPRFNNVSRFNQPVQGTSDNRIKNTTRSQPSHSATSHNSNNRYSSANTINQYDVETDDTPPFQSFSSEICSHCQQFGHEATACPNF